MRLTLDYLKESFAKYADKPAIIDHNGTRADDQNVLTLMFNLRAQEGMGK